jgi:RNA-directed DNA polymerase
VSLGSARPQMTRQLELPLESRGEAPGWKAYFQLAETPGTFIDLDKWIRHRLRAIHLKHWKRGTTIYRELTARGVPRAECRWLTQTA